MAMIKCSAPTSSSTTLAIEDYPVTLTDVTLARNKLLEIHRSAISTHHAKTGYKYPTIRLPHTFEPLIGLSTRIFQTVHEGALAFLVVIDGGLNYGSARTQHQQVHYIQHEQKVLQNEVTGEAVVGYILEVYLGSKFSAALGTLIFTTNRMIIARISGKTTQAGVDTLSQKEIVEEIFYESIQTIRIKIPPGKIGRGKVTVTTAKGEKVIWFAPKAGHRKQDWSFLKSPPRGLSAKLEVEQ